MNEEHKERYDVKDRIQRLEQRKIWSIGLEHLRNFDSFDVEFSSSGQILQITKYNRRGVVTGSEYFAYDDSGKTSRLLELDSAGRQIRGIDFVHQTEGNRVITVSETEGKFMGRTVEIYDGELLLAFASYDAKNLLMKEKTFQYTDNKLQTSDSRYYITDGSLVERFLSRYDSEGRIAETYGLTGDGKPLGDGKYKYEYDSEGRTSRVWTFNVLVSDEPATGVLVYGYKADGAGNWIERREFYRSREDSTWSMKTTTRKLTYYPKDW